MLLATDTYSALTQVVSVDLASLSEPARLT